MSRCKIPWYSYVQKQKYQRHSKKPRCQFDCVYRNDATMLVSLKFYFTSAYYAGPRRRHCDTVTARTGRGYPGRLWRSV